MAGRLMWPLRYDLDQVQTLTNSIANYLPEGTLTTGALVDNGHAIGVGIEYEGKRTAVRITDMANANPRLLARTAMHLLTT